MVAEPDGKGGYLVEIEQGSVTNGRICRWIWQSSDEPRSSLWGLLPSFDPSEDDAKEYADKVKFLWGVCPQRDRGMLAPRLSLLCKGTAWSQVRAIDPQLLPDPQTGYQVLLQALSS